MKPHPSHIDPTRAAAWLTSLGRAGWAAALSLAAFGQSADTSADTTTHATTHTSAHATTHTSAHTTARQLPPGSWLRAGERPIFPPEPADPPDPPNPPPAPAAAQSRLAYAQQCAADIGTIPAYDCMTQGVVVPITKTVNGVTTTITTPLGDSSCDKPVKLGLANEGQCVPFSRLVDLSPSGNADVTVMAICRKYHGTPASNTKFNDLAMIAHNRKTGTTCFFQSPVDGTPLEGTTVPSPMADSAAARQYWLEPSGAPNNVAFTAPAGIYCTNCHDADPFILSPWIQQVAKLAKWDPNGKYLVDKAGPFAPTASRPWVTAGLTPPQPFTQFAKCIACHRIGGSSLHVVANGPGGLHAQNGFPDFHGFMPPGNGDSAFWWPYVYNEAVFELDNCVNPSNGTPAAGCNARRAGTLH